MLRYLTNEQMRAVERDAFSRGIPSLLPMEKAAEALTDALRAYAPGKKVLFVCGGGNNGADGLAAARLWALSGGRSEALLIGTGQTEENRLQQRYLEYLGIPILTDDKSIDFPAYDAVVDALFGIGLSRPLQDPYPRIIEKINSAAFRLSADIPSGMNADTGHASGALVKADVTVTFHAPKQGLALTQRGESVGTLLTRDVGFLHGGEGIPAYEEADLESLRRPRPVNAHKGSCGRVLIMGGDPGMCGAAAMAALGALKAGAGLVTILCERASLPILQALVPNAMCVPLDRSGDIREYDSLAAGCGMRLSEEKKTLLLSLMDNAPRWVLDAGALPLAASSLPHPENGVITPHMGEAARMLGQAPGAVLDDPLGAAEALQKKTGAVTALKSAVTVIRDGTRTAFNTVGSPALAKGGSGDALCGILAAALCARGDVFEAVRFACLRMGIAGKRGASKHGTDGLLTGEMLSLLP